MIGLASRHLSTPIRAFTLTFDRPDYDESAIAREMAAKAGAEYYPIPIRQDDLADHFADAIWHAETLCFNAHGVAKFVLSAAPCATPATRSSSPVRAPTRSSAATRTSGATCCSTTTADRTRRPSSDCSEQLERANPVSRGLLLPDGQTISTEGVRTILGFTPSWIEATSATALQAARDAVAATSPRSSPGCDAYRALLDSLDVPGRLAGRAPVHQSLYLWSKTILADLHPRRSSGTGWRWRTRSRGACRFSTTTSSSSS